jgi:hypothetical protein
MPASEIPAVIVSAVMTGGTAVFADQPPPPSLENLARRISAPVFFIYATKGAGGEDNNPDYFKAAGGPKQIWKIDTSHTRGLDARPAEYERRVLAFFNRALLDD